MQTRRTLAMRCFCLALPQPCSAALASNRLAALMKIIFAMSKMFAFRLRLMGYRCLQVPDSAAYHAGSGKRVGRIAFLRFTTGTATQCVRLSKTCRAHCSGYCCRCTWHRIWRPSRFSSRKARAGLFCGPSAMPCVACQGCGKSGNTLKVPDRADSRNLASFKQNGTAGTSK